VIHRFRSSLRQPLPGRVDPETVRALLTEVCRPCHFFTAEDGWVWQTGQTVERPWEIFQGRLLPLAHTRVRQRFERWALFHPQQLAESGQPAEEPLLALYLDEEQGEVHVVRALLCYVVEGYDAGGQVILDREVQGWSAELVDTLQLGEFPDLETLRDALIEHLFHAVAGSRLPLTSVETPLPDFTFGKLFYCYRAACDSDGPLRSWRELLVLRDGLGDEETAKWLEFLVRAVAPEEVREPGEHLRPLNDPDAPAREQHKPDAPARDEHKPDAPARDAFLPVWRRLFNDISLSPWTNFADKALALMRSLEEQGSWARADRVDLLTWLLRQPGRHLSGYDLVTFHHRGANYPDALLLEAVLLELLPVVEQSPELFLDSPGEPPDSAVRLRRRGLRQGWLLIRQYQGHPVPDLPTSPGENARVLPPSHPRVPDEQILDPSRRRRRLFSTPLPITPGSSVWQVLRASALDLLHHPRERQELGAALFLDRPFGAGQQPAEPDTTLLLASLAYSRRLADRRVRLLHEADLLTREEAEWLTAHLDCAGLPLERIGGPVRPGTVSLADAARSSSDMVFLRTTTTSLAALREAFDWSSVTALPALADPWSRLALVTRSLDGPGLILWDAAYQSLLEVEPCLEWGYVRQAGQKIPAAGLKVVRIGGQPCAGPAIRISSWGTRAWISPPSSNS
jgi:hypothetical protein